MRTAPIALTVIVGLANSTRAQGVLYSEDFEQGTASWILGGIWNAEAQTDPCGSLAAPFPAGPNAVYCGRNGICDYDAGTAPHDLRSLVDVLIPAAGNTWLRYRNLLQTENIYWDIFDTTDVRVSTDGGVTWRLHASDTQAWEQDRLWRRSRVDLTGLAGQSVRVGFQLRANGFGNHDFGWLIDGIEIRNEPGEPFCEVGASWIPCPCGNGAPIGMGSVDAPWGGGCTRANGIGAELIAEGTASLAAGDAVLVARDMPASTFAVLVLGTPLATPTAFGDGARCLGGSQSRLVQRAVTGGTFSHPQPSGVPLHVQSGVTQPGASSSYQVVYRDASNHCTPSTFNATNGYRLTWTP